MKGQRLVNKLTDEIIEAQTEEELKSIFYRADGVDMSFQRELITWEQHQRLLGLINKIANLMR